MFVIAGREALDFAVFMLFILLLLGSAIFAFFQLTGEGLDPKLAFERLGATEGQR